MTSINPDRKPFVRFIALMMAGTSLIVIGIFLVLIQINNNADNPPSSFSAIPLAVNYPSPKLKLQDLSGRSVTFLDYTGKVVLVNLWATWCPPCRAEMPALQAFFDRYKNEGLVIVGINQEETLGVVEPFVKEFGLSFPIWMDEKYLAQREFNTASLPSSYVIDRKGRVRLMWIGGISKQNLEKFLPPIIIE
jgi:thiol-disulfide isomerase/thioredoxin